MIRTMLSHFRPAAFLAALAVTLLGFAGTASAEDDGFAEWDENEDGVLQEDEFNAGVDDESDYTEWDEDGDGMLNEDEYNAGVFDTMDNDDDGLIDDDEYDSDLL